MTLSAHEQAMDEWVGLFATRDEARCEATPKSCVWPKCDCDCDCWIPALEGAGQHSPSCRSVKRTKEVRA